METLKKSFEYKRVYERGKSYATTNLVLYVFNKKNKNNRFGFTISKKIGKAVIRNKIRRRLKEIIRKMGKEKKINKGYDFVFIARKPVVETEFFGLKEDVVTLFKKAKVYKQQKIKR